MREWNAQRTPEQIERRRQYVNAYRRRFIEAGLNKDGKPRQRVGRKRVLTEEQRKLNHAKCVKRWKEENREKARMSSRMSKRRNRHRVNEGRREYNRQSRLRAIERLGGFCKHCGFSDVRALEFDHIEPLLNTKNRSATAGVREILAMEDPSVIYQLLCANCHTIKTKEGREHWAYQRKREGDSMHGHLIQ